MANKSVNKIGKDFDKVVADMKKLAGDYAKAAGSKKQDLLKKLKDLTAKKKDLKSQLERAVMDADKSVTLQIDERYMKIALKSKIGRLVEQELAKSLPKNRSQRRLIESKMNSRMIELKKIMRATLTKEDYRILGASLGLVNEEEYSEDQTEDLLMQTFKDLASKGVIPKDEIPKDIDIDAMTKDDVEGAIQETRRPLNEGVTAILAIPAILDIIGRAIDWVYRKIFQSKADQEAYNAAKKKYKAMKKDPNVSDEELHHFYEENLINTKVGGALKKAGHWLHGKFSSPIRFIIAGFQWAFPSDSERGKGWSYFWKKSRKMTDIVFSIILIAIAGFEVGKEVIEVFKHGTEALSVAKGALAGAESGDIANSAESIYNMVKAVDVEALSVEAGEELVDAAASA